MAKMAECIFCGKVVRKVSLVDLVDWDLGDKLCIEDGCIFGICPQCCKKLKIEDKNNKGC